MAKKEKKKKVVRNKTKGWISDYYYTNKAYDEENRKRQQDEGMETKGLKNLNTTEKTCVVVIVLGVIGIIIKYIVL